MKFRVSSFGFRVGALLTAYCLLLTVFVACGPPSKKTIQKLHDGASVVLNVLVANETLPDQLLAEKIITAEQLPTVKKFISEAMSGTRTVVNGLANALAAEKPSLKFLAPIVADIIAQLRGLNSLVTHEMVQRFFGLAEIGLRVLGSYFALQISEARQLGFTDKQICARAGLPYNKASFDLLANTYDGKRFEEYANSRELAALNHPLAPIALRLAA